MRLEGGNTRVVFHLGIELQKLEATFNYESADVAPLASLSVQVRSHVHRQVHQVICLSKLSTAQRPIAVYEVPRAYDRGCVCFVGS